MASVLIKQQRLWSDEEAESDTDSAVDTASASDASDTVDKASWSLDARTKSVGKAGLEAARKCIRQNHR